jgi:hypothetical protein
MVGIYNQCTMVIWNGHNESPYKMNVHNNNEKIKIVIFDSLSLTNGYLSRGSEIIMKLYLHNYASISQYMDSI